MSPILFVVRPQGAVPADRHPRWPDAPLLVARGVDAETGARPGDRLQLRHLLPAGPAGQRGVPPDGGRGAGRRQQRSARLGLRRQVHTPYHVQNALSSFFERNSTRAHVTLIDWPQGDCSVAEASPDPFCLLWNKRLGARLCDCQSLLSMNFCFLICQPAALVECRNNPSLRPAAGFLIQWFIWAALWIMTQVP